VLHLRRFPRPFYLCTYDALRYHGVLSAGLCRFLFNSQFPRFRKFGVPRQYILRVAAAKAENALSHLSPAARNRQEKLGSLPTNARLLIQPPISIRFRTPMIMRGQTKQIYLVLPTRQEGNPTHEWEVLFHPSGSVQSCGKSLWGPRGWTPEYVTEYLTIIGRNSCLLLRGE